MTGFSKGGPWGSVPASLHCGYRLPSQPHMSAQACPRAFIRSPTCLDALHWSLPPACDPCPIAGSSSMFHSISWGPFACLLLPILHLICLLLPRAASFPGAAPFFSSLGVFVEWS